MILVFGSSNTDFVINIPDFPQKGETSTGGAFAVFPGGKGANQASAAALLGGEVRFVSRIGSDHYGDERISHLKRCGVNVSGVIRDKARSSGIAFIIVDKTGANRIVVAPGSNERLSPADIVKSSKFIKEAKVVLLQLEMPTATAIEVIERASRLDKVIILNPAPFKTLPRRILSKVSILTPNEPEAERLIGIRVSNRASAIRAQKRMGDFGIKKLLVTIGRKGVIIITPEIVRLIPAVKVKTVDTTGAGDAFNGALAVAVSKEMDICKAAEFAAAAASVSTTKHGAASSLPTLKEVEAKLH